MIQDIAPHVYANEYKNVRPTPDSLAIYFYEKKILIKKTGDTYEFPTFMDLEEENEDILTQGIYLFSIDQTECFLVDAIDIPKREGFNMEDVSLFRRKKPDHLDFIGITAYQLHTWYRSRRYCGVCGKPMVHSDKERMVYCVNCRQMEYPKICPAVIVGVTNGDKLLMSIYANRGYKNYALLAGFAEIGETIEETVHREVMEEVGLKVKNLRYYKSQPWSFSDTLLMGFFVDVDGDDTIRIDQEELAMADWFTRDEMKIEDDGLSLTNEMMMYFKNHGSVTEK